MIRLLPAHTDIHHSNGDFSFKKNGIAGCSLDFSSPFDQRLAAWQDILATLGWPQ